MLPTMEEYKKFSLRVTIKKETSKLDSKKENTNGDEARTKF